MIREIGLLSDADLARMEHYEEDGTVTGVAAWSRVPVQLAIGKRFSLVGTSIARGKCKTTGDRFGSRVSPGQRARSPRKRELSVSGRRSAARSSWPDVCGE